MYLLAKFGDYRSYRYGDINSYVKSYIDTLESTDPPYCQIFKIRNADLQFLSPGYGRQKNKKKKNKGNCRKIKRRRIKAIAKRFSFHANEISDV